MVKTRNILQNNVSIIDDVYSRGLDCCKVDVSLSLSTFRHLQRKKRQEIQRSSGGHLPSQQRRKKTDYKLFMVVCRGLGRDWLSSIALGGFPINDVVNDRWNAAELRSRLATDLKLTSRLCFYLCNV